MSSFNSCSVPSPPTPGAAPSRQTIVQTITMFSPLNVIHAREKQANRHSPLASECQKHRLPHAKEGAALTERRPLTYVTYVPATWSP